jgi:putative methionine-R-sulfoxide reductase with GAF domain
VTVDSRYWTAFGSTRSEIIVPIFAAGRDQVVGTIDVESEHFNAFDEKSESLFVMCADVVAQLWWNGQQTQGINARYGRVNAVG